MDKKPNKIHENLIPMKVNNHTVYRIAQNFGGRKLWQIVVNKHFGEQNIGRLAVLHSKIARIKIIGG